MAEPALAHQILGRYQLLVAVARGGMGQVWLGRLQGARGFNKLVAIKTLLPNQNDLARLEGMLAEEARIASLIQHANVVHTMELGEHEGMLYLVMEWVDGEPLGFLHDRAQERGGMPLIVAVQLIAQALSGLHAAHELADEHGPLGVVHRDVSPHNILVTYDGVAKLLDFGIAKATQQSPSGATETGEIKGKFSYMAPEQILGGEVDRRCDIFALGIVMYLLTTGKHPFKHHNTAAVIHSITTDEAVAPPSTLVPDYPEELEQILLKALEKNPDKRWGSAEEMRIALEQAMPEAFDDLGRAALREFMERAVGDRKLARREAVRRAQINADARDISSGARHALQASSQSASSLRAISLTQPGTREIVEMVTAQTGEHTRIAPPPMRRSAAPWLAAIAVLALAAALLPRALDLHSGSKAASAGIQGGAPLVTNEPPKPPSLPAATPAPAPAAESKPSAAADAAPAPAQPAAQTATALSASRPAVAAASHPGSPRASNKPADKAHASKGAPKPQSDLLAPDYAR